METLYQIWRQSIALITEKGWELVGALIILLVGWWLATVVSKLVFRKLEKSSVDNTLASFAKTLIYAAILAFAIISAVGLLGVQTASFAAVLAAAGLAVGLALQGSLSNFAAGVMILIFKPFKAEDFVEAGGATGTVKEVHIFHTILYTPDNKRVIVPNAQVTGNNIVNYSVNGTRRVDLIAGISYGDDLKKAKALLESVVKSDERVLDDPAPRVAVLEMADSSINFVVRPWVKASDYWDVYFDMTEKIKLELEANGFTIPFPQRDVWIKEQPAQPV